MTKAAAGEEVVLDASAVLALLNSEPGCDRVEESLDAAFVSSVNLAEVATKLADVGLSDDEVVRVLEGLDLEVVPFDEGSALAAGALRASTRKVGLSLGDRACLALARHLVLPVLTSDRRWKDLRVGVEIRLLRG